MTSDEHGLGDPPAGKPPAGRQKLADAIAARQRAQVVAGLRSLTRPAASSRARTVGASTNGGVPNPAAADAERCDLCDTTIAEDHRHLLHLVERRIECVCEACWARRSGDPEYRPTGSRTVWLEDLQLPDELWASFQIPIGLSFFMESTTAGCVVALYPSPAGATESELHFSSWSQLVALNPILAALEPDIEGLIVNRQSDPPGYVIAPIDRCYELTGMIKANWEGLSGGEKVADVVTAFFERLRAQGARSELGEGIAL